MHNLETADKIFHEMIKNDPNFAKKLVLQWRELMPEEYAKVMHLAKWGYHIVTRDLYDKGLKFIVNNQHQPIDTWEVEEILNVAKNYINIEEEPYYNYDLAMMTNILKGDIFPIVKDAEKVVLIAIEFLSDADFPEYDASERAYRWVECHLSKQKKELENEFKH